MLWKTFSKGFRLCLRGGPGPRLWSVRHRESRPCSYRLRSSWEEVSVLSLLLIEPLRARFHCVDPSTECVCPQSNTPEGEVGRVTEETPLVSAVQMSYYSFLLCTEGDVLNDGSPTWGRCKRFHPWPRHWQVQENRSVVYVRTVCSSSCYHSSVLQVYTVSRKHGGRRSWVVFEMQYEFMNGRDLCHVSSEGHPEDRVLVRQTACFMTSPPVAAIRWIVLLCGALCS